MKKTIHIFIFILIINIFTISCGRENTKNINIYFVNKDTMTLTPISTIITESSPQQEAEGIINALIKGHDDIPNIVRLIPNIEDCMTVHVEDSIAYVDIKQEMIDNHKSDFDSEMLTIYSIVNSLTNIDEVINVRFTINGKEQKDFKGNIDMRETFIPDYCV